MSDPVSQNDTQRIHRMMTKEYSLEIYTNITDVRCILISAYRPPYALTQDSTHPPEYYNPEYDMKPDHGTVRPLYLISILCPVANFILRAIHRLLTSMGWPFRLHPQSIAYSVLMSWILLLAQS